MLPLMLRMMLIPLLAMRAVGREYGKCYDKQTLSYWVGLSHRNASLTLTHDRHAMQHVGRSGDFRWYQLMGRFGVIQWGAKLLQCLTPNQDMKCSAINCGKFTLLWWEQITYKPLAITLSPGSCDFAYILQRYIYYKTPIPLQQFCTLYSLHWNQVFFGYVWSYKQTYMY